MRHFPTVSFACLLLSFPFTVHAQSTNALLTGRITDPSNAVIVGARIAAIDTHTNLRYQSASNRSGEYYLPNLPPGRYRIEVEKPGFNKLVKPDVVLHVQDALEINFELKVGAASQTVTVEGGAPLLDVSGATVSTLIDNRFVENMPLNGRSFSSLID